MNSPSREPSAKEMFTQCRVLKTRRHRKNKDRLKQIEKRTKDFITSNKKLWDTQITNNTDSVDNQMDIFLPNQAKSCCLLDRAVGKPKKIIGLDNFDRNSDAELTNDKAMRNFYLKSTVDNSKKSKKIAKAERKGKNITKHRGVSKKARKAQRKELSKNLKNVLKTFGNLSLAKDKE